MDVFQPSSIQKTDNRPTERKKSPKTKARHKRRLSAAEIRSRVEANKKKNHGPAARVELSKTAKMVGQEIADPEAGKKQKHLLESDVSPNQPDKPETREKLKDLVNNGGFSFSEKERAVLAEILKK